MTQLYNVTWQSPHGKQVTARSITEAQARVLIEENQRHTPDWTYTVQPPLPDLQAMLDAANARIAELEAVCREVVEVLEINMVQDDEFDFVSFAVPVLTAPMARYGKMQNVILDVDDLEREALYTALCRLLDTLPDSR